MTRGNESALIRYTCTDRNVERTSVSMMIGILARVEHRTLNYVNAHARCSQGGNNALNIERKVHAGKLIILIIYMFMNPGRGRALPRYLGRALPDSCKYSL